MAARRIATLSLGLITAGSAGLYASNEDVRRTVKLWSSLGPVITHYRFVETKLKWIPASSPEEEDAEWDRLHQLYADTVMGTFRDLRGFYVKVAQLLASRAEDLPEIYIEKLRMLEDGVPPLLDGEGVKKTVQDTLGLKSWQDAFSHIDDKPLGSASIGQVHKAKLAKTGETVVIKVQSPRSEELLRRDIAAARSFCATFAPEQLIQFDEIENIFKTEFDYREEAEHLRQVRENMKQFENLVVVPKPYLELCSPQVLTMQFLEGPKLVDGIRRQGEEYAKLKGTTFEQLQKDMREKFRKEGLPPPYKGPSATQMELYRRMIKLSDSIVNIPVWCVNVVHSGLKGTLGFSFLSKPLEYRKSFIPLNSAQIMNTIMKVHGHQLFIDGMFNADPHSGNFLLLKDGRIGLIDYGQIKKLTKQERRDIAELFIAVGNRDKEAIYNAAIRAGYKSKYLNKEVMFRMCIVGFDQDGRQVTDGLNIQQFVEKMHALDPWSGVSNTYIMPMRLAMLLRGVGLMLNHPVSCATEWRSLAEKALKLYPETTASS